MKRFLRNLIVVALIAGAVCTALAQSDNGSSKAVASPALGEPMTIAWRYDVAALNLTPAVDDERVYLPAAGGVLLSLRAADGLLNWRSEMGGELSASPVADQKAVYVATETGKAESGVRRATGALRSLGREGGVTQWMRTLASPLRGSLTLSEGKLFAGSNDGKVYAFDSRNGTALWVHDYGSPFNGQPVHFDKRVYIGSEDGNLLALDETTGKLLWYHRTRGPVRGPVAHVGGTVYFGSGDGYVYAVATETGRRLWRRRTGAGVQVVRLIGDELLVASFDNFVYKFSLAGRQLWKRQLPGRISSQPLVTEKEALFTPLSSFAGVVLSLRDGRPANSLTLEEEITTSASPVAVGKIVLITTERGLRSFKPRD